MERVKKILRTFVVNERAKTSNGQIKIRVDPRWDSFPDPYGVRDSLFAGRRDDLDKLTNWIINSDGGSVLIRGHRGIGKSAFVYKAISDARKQLQSQDNLLFIPVNLSQIDSPITTTSADNLEGSIVLKRLILSLRQSREDSKDIEDLFNLTLSSKAESEDERLTSRVIGLDLTYKIAFSSFLAIILSLVQPSLIKIFPQTINLSALPLLPFLYPAISFIFKLKSSQSKKIHTKISLNNPNYLSLRLRKVLEDDIYIPVFVIDELDKLFNDDINFAIKKINKIVRELKYLFTVSKARFIFIVHEGYPHWKSTFIKGRPEESTYFNWDILLPPISFKDIEIYFEGIKKQEIDTEGQKLLKEFIYYISYESERVFSELNQALRFFIRYERSTPYLVIKDFRKTPVGCRRMREAVLENILEDIITYGPDYIDPTDKQQELNRKTYLMLRKAAGDIEQNRFSGGDLASQSIESLVNMYSTPESPDFVCKLDLYQSGQVKSKMKDFFVSMQENAFSIQVDKSKIFYDKNNTNDVSINATLRFEDINIGSLPKTNFTGLPSESIEFKNSAEAFKKVLNDLKSELNYDDITLSTGVFGNEGVGMLAAISLADKIKLDDYRTHNLEEIQKFKEENPEPFKILQEEPINRLKNWLSFKTPSSKVEDIYNMSKKKLGFKIRIGSHFIYIFNSNIRGTLDQNTHEQLRKAVVVLLNGALLNSKYKLLKGINLANVDLNNLNGVSKILEIINTKLKKSVAGKKTTLLPGSGEDHQPAFIDIDEESPGSILIKIEFLMKSLSDYWRVGVLLGQTSKNKYEPLGATGFPLFHLNKDIGENTVRLTTYSNGKHPPDVVKDLGLDPTNEIKFSLLIKDQNILRIFVNDKSVFNSIVDPNFLKRASILAWGDRKDEYKGVDILSYYYDKFT